MEGIQRCPHLVAEQPVAPESDLVGHLAAVSRLVRFLQWKLVDGETTPGPSGSVSASRSGSLRGMLRGRLLCATGKQWPGVPPSLRTPASVPFCFL